MRTVQIRLTEDHLKFIDNLIRKGVYAHRSDALRDAVRGIAEKYKWVFLGREK